jgi:hypothetical protein
MVSDRRSPLTRRCSGRYASAAPTVFADSNHRAPGPLRGTRSAAERHVVRGLSTDLSKSKGSHPPCPASSRRPGRASLVLHLSHSARDMAVLGPTRTTGRRFASSGDAPHFRITLAPYGIASMASRLWHRAYGTAPMIQRRFVYRGTLRFLVVGPLASWGLHLRGVAISSRVHSSRTAVRASPAPREPRNNGFLVRPDG